MANPALKNPNNKPNHLYVVTYLARVECDNVSLYDAKGILKEVAKRTKLIERDCVVMTTSGVRCRQLLEEEDPCFVRVLQSQCLPTDTVVHVLDRSTNMSEKV